MTVLAGLIGRDEVVRMRRAWYARLRAQGFVDVEYESTTMLKVACRENRHGPSPLEYESALEYYSRAAAMLHHYPWTDAKERDVWRRHCAGDSARQIAKGCRMSHPQLAWRVVARLKRQLAAWWPEHQATLDREDAACELARLRAQGAIARTGGRAHWRHVLAAR